MRRLTTSTTCLWVNSPHCVKSRSMQTPLRNFPPIKRRSAWDQMPADGNSRLISNINRSKETEVRDIFHKRCVLYFPHNRFEEPAWLNEDNLEARAEYMDVKHVQHYTNRKLINYSSLQDNQNWLFDVVYDMSAFERLTENLLVSDRNRNQPRLIQEWKGFRGPSTTAFEIALDIVRHIMRGSGDVTLKIGGRLDRAVALLERSKKSPKHLSTL